jgi:CMP/dCMP kinase
MDTGRLYRAVGVAALKQGVPLDAAGPLSDLARSLDLSDFIEHELRSAEAGKAASVVAAIPSVRQALFELQRAFATREGGALLDGRDIGTVIAPDADVKLWVDADVTQRGVRRWKELVGNGEDVTLESVIDQLKIRDERDQGRADAPAAMAADAILIDTTDLTIDAAVEKALAAVEAALARGKTA